MINRQRRQVRVKRFRTNGGRRKSSSIYRINRIFRKILKDISNSNESSRRNNQNQGTPNRHLESEIPVLPEIKPTLSESDKEILKIRQEVNCNEKSGGSGIDLESLIRELECGDNLSKGRGKGPKINEHAKLADEVNKQTGMNLEDLFPEAKVQKPTGIDDLLQDTRILNAKPPKDLFATGDFDLISESSPTIPKIHDFLKKMEKPDQKHREVLKSNSLEANQKNRNIIKLIREYATAPNGSPNGKLLAEMIDDENVLLIGLKSSFQNKLIDRLNNIKRIPAQTYDFESKFHKFLKCLLNSSNTDLKIAVESLVSRIRTNLHEVKSNYPTGMTTLTSIFTLSEKLNTTHEALSSFLNCIIRNQRNTFNECSNELLKNLNTLGLDLIELESINENFSVFCWTGHIFNSTDIEYDDDKQKWMTVIENYLHDLNYPRNLFVNLKTIFDEQKSLTTDDVNVKLDDLMKQVVNHVDYDSAFQAHVIRIVKEALRNVTVNISCQRDSVIKLTVSGEFLRLSQIVNNANCPNYQVLEIFAIEKIVIDCDLIGGNILVAIFAPVWEIVMNRRIVLDGASRNLTNDDYMVGFFVWLLLIVL